ncbi:bifunctional phosphoribosylaminoimidazolecarboxamide formyltransferase/IMP cyclohydrolase [Candidatus Woesearchaeota archaeon]|nr:bifunctional phosphoribosylaminoimidazolecarboxamide formyltransferase/IMP cyclohydrolase [Candidatus Woesearchaeota archaeon]
MIKIKRALLSVHEKEGIVRLARVLEKHSIEILSSGGTAKLLRDNKVKVQEISDYTQSPEMMHGRVKTLHPRIFGGILARRDADKGEMKKNGILPIDLVVVNLYPFEQVSVNDKVTLQEAVDNIDIGGPSLIRAAAKNHEFVAVVVAPSDYEMLEKELDENKGSVGKELSRNLAVRAFSLTAHYDALINEFFSQKFGIEGHPEILNLTYSKMFDLRYGENPHQTGAVYRELKKRESSVCFSKQLHGKQLSFNNILDVNEALELVKEFEEPAVAVIKHTNPSGVASSSSIKEAFERAYGADSLSAFGGIIALNRPCTMELAEPISRIFVEVVIAPKFNNDALKLLMEKKNIRLLESGDMSKSDEGIDVRTVSGGLLVQSRNCPKISPKDLKVVTRRKPSKEEIADMLFSWKVNRHVKSNAIVLAKGNATVGIGAGQMSRVDAVKIAREKSKGKCNGSVMCSDAFFPFRDGIDEAALGGVTAIIQPGGSIKDEEVIKAADEHNMAMVFTGIRLFKH